MPIDASIPLQSQAPQNPLDRYARVLALKNAMGQQQLQQGQQQLQQQQIQQGQQSISAQQALDQAFQQGFTKGPDGKLTLNREGVVNALTQRGVGHLVPGVLENFNKMDEAQVKLQKSQVEAKTATDDYTANSLLTIADAKFDPSIALGTIAHARESGAIPPDQALQIAEKITQNPTPEAVQALIQPLLDKSPAYQKLADSRKTAQASVDSAAARQTTADTGKQREGREADQQKFMGALSELSANPPKSAAEYQQRVGRLPYGVANRIFQAVPPTQYDPATAAQALRQLGMTPEQQTTTTNTENYRQAELQQGAARLRISQAELGLKQQENDRKYGALTPDQKVISDKLAHGDYDPAQLGRLPGQDKEKIMAAAVLTAAGEGRDWTPQIYAAKKDFTDPKGKQAQNLGTISRIVGHIGRFEENSKNAGFSPLYAAGKNLTGAASVLSEDSHAIAAELEKLVSGGVGSISQVEAWQKALSSPLHDVRQKAIDEISQLIGSQYEGMNQTYKAAVGADLPIQKYVSPAGQKWLKSKNINVGGAATPTQAESPAAATQTANPVAPIALKDGTFLTPHDAAAAAKFRKEQPELIK